MPVLNISRSCKIEIMFVINQCAFTRFDHLILNRLVQLTKLFTPTANKHKTHLPRDRKTQLFLSDTLVSREKEGKIEMIHRCFRRALGRMEITRRGWRRQGCAGIDGRANVHRRPPSRSFADFLLFLHSSNPFSLPFHISIPFGNPLAPTLHLSCASRRSGSKILSEYAFSAPGSRPLSRRKSIYLGPSWRVFCFYEH